MKLVFLNVWHGELHDKLRAFIMAQIRDTDVFCFQEADGEESESLLDELLSGYQKLTSYKLVTEDCHCANAMFVSPQFLIAESGTLLDKIPDCGQGLFVQLRTSENAFYICDVQGHSRPGDKLDTPGRLAQSQGLIDYFKDKSVPAIIGGDFNLMPQTQSVSLFEETGYQNLIDDYAITCTRNHFVWDRYPESKQNFADFVFVDKSFAVKSFMVPDDEVSDHQPMILEISV